MPTALQGLAHHLPPRQAVGEAERPLAGEPGGPSDLVLAPAQRAAAAAGIGVDDIELIVFATMTPDVAFPGAACFLQHKLGGNTVGALDVRSQCAGFLTGLQIADAFVRAGRYAHVLLAAAEVHSTGLDYDGEGRALAARYGDGAAAAVLGLGDTGVEAVVTGADGAYYERFWCEHPASRQHPARMTADDLAAGRHFLRVDDAHVAAFARERLPAVVDEALQAAGAAADGVDLFILSHLFPEVAAAAGEALRVPADRTLIAGEQHGHLTAASLPVALAEAREAGRVGPGARVVLATCGAGYAWGAAVLVL